MDLMNATRSASCFLVESFRVEKELGDSWATLGFEVGIVAVPFVRRGLGDAAQGAIGHAIAAELREFPGSMLRHRCDCRDGR